jgi:ABC-type multidrug transport system ATPase subunit
MEIRLENVWFTYDGSSYVLKNVNLEFANPGLYILMGPNGSGKTTLLKIISLLFKPTKGRVLIDNADFWNMIEKDKQEVRSRIAYVRDKPILVRGTARYNLELGLKLRNNVEVDKSLINNLVKRYMLEDLLSKPASKLSSGQAKIIAILRALILNARILALDEPFTFLDNTRTMLLIQDLVKLVDNGSIILIATHYMHRELRTRAKQITELVNGEIIHT